MQMESVFHRQFFALSRTYLERAFVGDSVELKKHCT